MSRAGVLDLSRREPPELSALRVSIDLQASQHQNPAVLFTSPTARQGTSTIACAYALSAAARRRVLLVDADLPRPSLAERLGESRERGLSEIVGEALPFEEAVRKIQVGEVGMDFLPAGRPMPGAVDLLRSRTLADLVEGLIESYDLVVFDSPPASVYPDARALSPLPQVDTVVVVRRYQPRKRLSGALSELQRAGANVLGIVVNEG